MCGIAGFLVHEPGAVVESSRLDILARHLLEGCDARGGDATGLLALGADGSQLWRKASCDAYRYVRNWRTLAPDVAVCLLHTRLATQGDHAFPENNHPVRRGPFFVVHNGHVTNDAELCGEDRHGAVDTEGIVCAVAHEGTLDAAPVALARVKGDAAVGIVDARDTGRLVLGVTRTSPLYVHRNPHLTVFASTGAILGAAWAKTFGGRLPTLGRATEEGTVLDVTAHGIARHTFEPASPARRAWSFHEWRPAQPHTDSGAGWTSWSNTEEEDASAYDADICTIADRVLGAAGTWEPCEWCGDYYVARSMHRCSSGYVCGGCHEELAEAGILA